MSARTRGLHPKLLSLAAIIAAAIMTFGASEARAVDCCNEWIIDNQTTCSFYLCIDIGQPTPYCQWMNPGSNLFNFTWCVPIANMYVTNLWGTRLNLPNGVGNFIQVQISATCLVTITCTQNCFWVVTM